MRHGIRHAVAVGLLAVLALGAVMALSGTAAAQEQVFDAPEGPEVTVPDGVEIDPPADPYPDNNTVDLGTNEFTSLNPNSSLTLEESGTEYVVSDVSIPGDTYPQLILRNGDVSVQLYENVTYYDHRGVWDLDDWETDFAASTASGGGEVHMNIAGEASEWAAYDSAGELADYGSAGFSNTYNVQLGDGYATEPITLREQADPLLSNPQPADGNDVSSSPATLGIDVEWEAFSSQDVTLTYRLAEAGNDPFNSSETMETVDVTATENGTYTAQPTSTLDAGETYNWGVEATGDTFGSDQTDVMEFWTPGEVEIRNETSYALIDNQEVTATFYTDDGAIERTTSDGTMDLSGLPANEELVVQLEAAGYESSWQNENYDSGRTVLLDSISQQGVWYLLSEDADSVHVEFRLNDDTGNFPPSDSKIYVSKAMPDDPDNPGDERTYQTITSDYFGADRQFPARLEAAQRYRLSVENAEGDRRSLGTYSALSSGVKELNVGTVSWPVPEGDPYTAEANLINDGSTIEFLFADPEGRTESLDVRIYDRFNESNELVRDTAQDTENYRLTYDLNETEQQTQWVVEYEAARDPSVSGTIPVGGDASVPMPVSPTWLHTISVVFLTVVMAAFPGRLSAVGGVAIVGMAGVLMLLGFLNVPTFAWFIAGLIAVLGLIRSRQQLGV